MSIVLLSDAYKVNEDFKNYVDKYALCHCMFPEDCFRHLVVQQYYLYLKEEGRV